MPNTGLEREAAAALIGGGPTAGDRLRVGFIPLVDCAPLLVAHERGFAAAEGLDLDLVRETSWANIRDRIVLGHFDAAHMLAPMTIAANLALGHLKAPVVTPFVLNLGGNAVAVSTAVHTRMREGGGAVSLADPAATGAALARAIRAGAARGEAPLTLAMVYPFSGQNYELRHWLAAAGVDPDRDVRLVVVPPPFMVDALTAGQVDGFCVGAPWPSLSVDAGVGCLVATKSAILPKSPEKVVGVRESWAERHPDRLARLVRALDRAAAWCDDPANHEDLAAILARPGYLGVPAEIVMRSLSGLLRTEQGGAAVHAPDYIIFHRGGANRPEAAHALWLATQMLRWGQAADPDAAYAAARRSFRADLYDAALGRGAAEPVTGLTPFDGLRFDAADPAAYLAALPRPPGPAAAPGDD
ncbi:CmpA/NrtA family ABC transporter substrate-binding protein [Prosthecomicrobium sp. N25]|uniref:CmpA/NrtA family ABC transporter substrate-binding protein n=1 Tax=Prosthecomicrobium sp. N25 TaxID=3129254 RepID=UPI003076E8CE